MKVSWLEGDQRQFKLVSTLLNQFLRISQYHRHIRHIIRRQ